MPASSLPFVIRAALVLAGVSWYMVATREEMMIRHVQAGGAVAVIRVVAIDPLPDSTNGNPPRIRIAIEESLAGGLETAEVDAIWTPYPYDSHGDGAGVSAEFVKNWRATPLAPPPAGWTWIVAMDRDVAGVFSISPHLRDMLRDGLREETLAILKKAKPAKPAKQPPSPPAPRK